MSDSSIVIIQGTVGLYTVATRCHRCFAVTLKYTEDSSLKILPHSLVCQKQEWVNLTESLILNFASCKVGKSKAMSCTHF